MYSRWGFSENAAALPGLLAAPSGHQLPFPCALTSRKASLFMFWSRMVFKGCMVCISAPVSPLLFFFWRAVYSWYKSFVAAPGFSVMMLLATFWSNCTPSRWSVGSKREKLFSLAPETLGVKIFYIFRHWHWITSEYQRYSQGPIVWIMLCPFKHIIPL